MFGMHRADLLAILLARLPSECVHPDHRAVGFAQDEAQARVTFANGQTVEADVVVGADGIHSSMQRYVTPPSQPISANSVAYRGVVNAEQAGWPRGAMRNFLGSGKHFLVYPVRGNELVCYVGFMPSHAAAKESWSAPGDPETLRGEFSGWNSMVDGVLAAIDTCFWWGLYDREPLPAWTSGRLTLLGDAAHPMLPHVGQGANQAIEDGVALATLLERMPPVEALAAYERLRRTHTARVQSSARRNGARYDSATGDVVDRDRQLSNQAQERAWIWGYDAHQAALTVEATQRDLGPTTIDGL
jgi:salicylate hydroxylase